MTADICACRCERPAALGLLCPEHGQRLADHYGAREGMGSRGRLIHGLPWMYDHIQLAYPSLAGWSGGNRDGGDIDDAEAEKLSAVMALRQDIHDHLAAVVADLAERLDRKGPNLATTQRLAVHRSAGWLVAHIEPLRAAQGVRATAEALAAAGDEASGTDITDDSDFDGEGGPAWAQPEAWTLRVAAMTEMDAATAREAVRSVLEEADALASRAHALAPWREAPSKLDGIPCRCGTTGTLHDFGEVIICWRCARKYSPDEYVILTKVMAHRFADQIGIE